MNAAAISQMQEYYKQRAPIYDQSMAYDQAEVVVRHKPVIDALCSWMTGRDVLEIACGPAFWTNWVAQTAKSILATDYNESTLAEARKKGIEPQRVKFQVADAYALPDFGRQFDAAFAVDWFCHVPLNKRNCFLHGLHAHLKPRSPVVFCDQLPRPEEGFSSENGDHFQVRTLPDGSRHNVIKNFPTETEVRHLFDSYSQKIEYKSLPEVRRWMVFYFLPASFS